MTGLFAKSRIVAPPGFNRWRVPPASIAIHLCIGSVYAWSIFNPPLMRVLGAAAPAADDWTLAQTSRTFVVAIVCLGLAAAVAGKWLERVGPRVVGCVAAVCWGGGFLIGAAGIAWHHLELLYLGYGVLGGIGLGLGYVSPVSTLIRWFPDRRGLAAGMAIMGFGGGAIIAVPVNERLLQHFYRAPQFVGPAESVDLQTVDGRRTALVDGARREVVVVTSAEAAKLPQPSAAGVYVVGTGRTGAVETFCTLGIVYFVVMFGAAMAYRIPAPDWVPVVGKAAMKNAADAVLPLTPNPSPARGEGNQTIPAPACDVGEAVRTRQFYLLWIMLCLNVTAGIGVLAVAKTMLEEIFGSALPSLVTNRFTQTFVLMTSVFNMLGRFVWASASDYLGRRRTYMIFFALGAVLYAVVPEIARRVGTDPRAVWLWTFYGVTMLIFTMYGGGFATIPAYLADVFGTRNVGAIHGRLLTAWSVAGVLGPVAVTALRERAVSDAVHRLAGVVDPQVFAKRFGAPIEQIDALLASKTVDIAKLLELAPSGTVDPTTTLYNSTMYLMAGLLVVALAANFLMRPLAETRAKK